MHKTLQKYFGYTIFRPLQEDITNDVLLGKDTFVLMPTGGKNEIIVEVSENIGQLDFEPCVKFVRLKTVTGMEKRAFSLSSAT